MGGPKLKRLGILSRNEDERVEKLGKYFRDYLFAWLAEVFKGTKWTTGVERELALVFLELACAVRLSRDELGNDDQNAEHIERVSKELLEMLDRELGS